MDEVKRRPSGFGTDSRMMLYPTVMPTSPLTRNGTNILEKMRQNSPKINRYLENKGKSTLVNQILNSGVYGSQQKKAKTPIRSRYMEEFN